MTWGEFKKLVDDAGVKDDSVISFLDFGGCPNADVMVSTDGATVECSALEV